MFSSNGKQAVFYLYSRKHGDLERDYNKFQIQPTYFSQGNGNYRDINQNRRCDTWFNPQIGDFNCITFMNLLQIDGFNPLVVKGDTFTLQDKDGFIAALGGRIDSPVLDKIMAIVSGKFTPGMLIMSLEKMQYACHFRLMNCSIFSCPCASKTRWRISQKDIGQTTGIITSICLKVTSPFTLRTSGS